MSEVRLQKFLADAGICSRRAAEALIAQGEVWVNGTAASLGQKITPGIDKVSVSGKPVRTTIDDGVKALELADAATTSWREQRIVTL